MENGEHWDWARFESWMKRAFPFLQDDLQFDRFFREPQAIGELVQHALDHTFNGSVVAGMPAGSSRFRADLFETHRSLIARVRLPDQAVGQTRTLVSRQRLRIEWPPDGKREIALSKPVNPKRSRARLKDGVLEVHMPKLQQSVHYYEL